MGCIKLNIAEENRGVLKVVHRRDIEIKNKYGNYYPFGMQWDTPNLDLNGNSLKPTGSKTKYTYNGKEFIDDLGIGLHDYGARYYDPAIARFSSIDRFAEKYAFQSGFAYAANNPIKYIDVNGDSIRINGVLYTEGMSAEGQDELVTMGIQAMNFLFENSETAKTDFADRDGNKVEGNAIKDFADGGKYSDITVSVTVSEHTPTVAYGDPEDRPDPNEVSVYFNPVDGATVEEDYGMPGGKYAPVVNLLHEFGHVWDWVTNPSKMIRFGNIYDPVTGDNIREVKAMRLQNQLARKIGQAEIKNHSSAKSHPTKGPLSTSK